MHTKFFGGFEIDVVNANTGATNNLKIFSSGKNFASNFGAATNDHTFVFTDFFQKLGSFDAFAIDCFASLVDQVNTVALQAVCDNYFPCHN